MNDLIRWMARKRFEEGKRREHEARLLAEGLKARAIRLKAEAG